jgi:hypothetical protein
MKKFLSGLFILSLNDCYAGTGGASDGILFVLAIIVIILLLLATGYLIDFLKIRIKDARTRRWLKRNMKDHEGEFMNSWNEAIPGLDGLSGL